MDYKELIELSKKAVAEWQGTHEYYQAATLITALCEAIEILLAEQEAAGFKHGKWLQTAKWWQGGSMWKKCSVCGTLHYKSPFCPSCGAKMDLQSHSTPPDRKQIES